MTKNIAAPGFCLILGLLVLGGCAKKQDNRVIIYTCTEDFRTEHMRRLLNEEFPGYDITVQVLTTGNCAAKLKAEGVSTEADIVLNLETAYLEGLTDILADLSSFDASEFLPELVPFHRRHLPWDKSSGAVVISRKKLQERGLPAPGSYQDLTDPLYRGLLSMPNPKTSGTGYMFLKGLINAWGEEEAFAYFDKFAENVLQFTSSGSGPVNALIQGEVLIGLGMTITAVEAVNNRGADFELIFFKEGAPSNTSGMGIIKGKETKPAVQEVFKFAATKLVREDKDLYCPEPVFKNQVNRIPHYPKDIPYMDMAGINDSAEKERLLARWNY
ncbi:MAG: extracellular solute-binding protein [Treponema sp.]|jgi:iron(III) transport system substrate-binding protein|nr:extracellular solute-binding protein [Treponema sp.]